MWKLSALLILLLAFALRLYALDTRMVWYDEAFSVLLSEKAPLDIVRGTAADIQPPLYYLLLHYWQGLGDQVFVMRLLSVGFALLSVALAFPLTRALLQSDAPYGAMLLLAFSPFQIAYAQELRMYSLLEFSLLLYTYAFVKLWRGDTRARFVILLVLAGTEGLYTQSVAVVTWLVPMLYVLLRREWRTLKPLLIGQGVSLLLFAAWLAIMATQLVNIQALYWTTRPGLVEFVQLALALTTFQPVPDWYLIIALFVTLMLLAVLILQLVRMQDNGSSDGVGLILAFVVFPALLMSAISYAGRSIFIVRALIVSQAMFLILVAWWLSRIRTMSLRRAAMALALLVILVPLSYQYKYDQFPRSPFIQANRFLRANVSDGDVIVHDNKLSYFPMYLYDRALAQTWIADPPTAGSNTLAPETIAVLSLPPKSLPEATLDKARVWFVIFQRAIEEAGGESEQANLAWLDQHYRRIRVERFNDLDLFLYQ